MADVVKDRIFTHDQGDTMNNKLDAINNTLTARLTDREFANVLVGSTTVQATLKGDTLNLVAGDNITLTPDNANKRITINAPNMVKTSGAQTIAGVKTFSDVPLISGSLAATDDSTKAATTAYVKDNVPKSVGSGTKPVYTDSNGKVTASNSSVGDTDTPIYMNGGTLTAMSETLFSKIVTHLASATAATISSLNTSSLFYRMLTWALTASGVQYNLTNSSAWYVCLGSLFGGLIIQGGTRTTTAGAWGMTGYTISATTIYGFFTSFDFDAVNSEETVVMTARKNVDNYKAFMATKLITANSVSMHSVKSMTWFAICKA